MEYSSISENENGPHVKEIGDYAFYECTALRDVYVRAMTPPAITMIFNTPGITVHVPATALAAYRSNPNWRTYRLVGDL
ncbi:MAG: hypothetical protein J6R07_01950 [Bacteroidaceae bacterium]|nr:hypothetical protein [Bacteroidaceae bacterium]